MRFEQAAHEVQHLLRMASWSNVKEGPPDPLFPIQHEGGPCRDPVTQDAEGLRQFAAAIRQERNGKAVLLGTGAVRLDRVNAYAENVAVERGELVVQIAKLLALDGASGRVVSGVKIADNVAPAGIPKPPFAAMLVA